MTKEQREQQPQEEQKEQTKELPKREIIIETDGNSINIKKAEVAGSLELKAILMALLDNLK